jgi:hypothetical protein
MRDCGTKRVGNDVKLVIRLAALVFIVTTAPPQSFGSKGVAVACLG